MSTFIRPAWADAFETLAYRGDAVNLGDPTGLKAALAAATAHATIKAVRLSAGVYDDPAAFEGGIIGNEDITIIPTPGALLAPPVGEGAEIAGGVPDGINFQWIDKASMSRVSFKRYGPTRVIKPEWPGAYCDRASDDWDVCQWAVTKGAEARMRIEMMRVYGLASPLVFPESSGWSFTHHGSWEAAVSDVPDSGFFWCGVAGTIGAPIAMVEFRASDFYNIDALWCHNRAAGFYKDYITGVLFRNGDAGRRLGANMRIKRLGIAGTYVGLCIGNHEFDEFDSNIEAHTIDEYLAYDVDHIMKVDSRAIDNIQIGRIRALGHPTNRPRDYLIKVRRSGGYFNVDRCWLGASYLVAGAAAIDQTSDQGCPVIFRSIEGESAVTLPANGVGAADVGNTGNGTITAAPAVNAATATKGIYVVTCTAAALNGGTFEVVDENAIVVGNATVGIAFTTEITFTITDGAIDFIVGDFFTVDVIETPIECRLMDIINDGGRGKAMLENISMVEDQFIDANGDTMILDYDSGVHLVTCSLSGNVKVQGGLVVATDVTFFGDSDFVVSGTGELVRTGISHRSAMGTQAFLDPDASGVRRTLQSPNFVDMQGKQGRSTGTADVLHGVAYKLCTLDLTFAAGSSGVAGEIQYMVYRGGNLTRHAQAYGRIFFSASMTDSDVVTAADPIIVGGVSKATGGTYAASDPQIATSKVITGTTVAIYLTQTNSHSSDSMRIAYTVETMTQRSNSAPHLFEMITLP